MPGLLVRPDWDRDSELIKAEQHSRPADRIIASMWVWVTDLRYTSAELAVSKTEHERLMGKAVVRQRTFGEKSATVAEHRAIADDDEVFQARLRYRLAEHRIAEVKAALAVLHAQIDDLRTQAADARAAGAWEARSGT